ncbi:hypothetical protein PILCRDRAFT_16928 [Piloderma croceum F 1598]|uniref:Ndc10 domain-containing protein n=1 Tax=Piloderma croceum (strain F 1598) TaxID=765440 RepID=A0A0C3ACV7_PILCF|nr:hypothetical protein PILCRDRAFT_16928 [Piloderma croceum F 1598]
MHKENNIEITKATHAGRTYGAMNSHAHSATAFPIDALLGAASFNAHKPEEYYLPQNDLRPPVDCLAYLFPWVEHKMAALET